MYRNIALERLAELKIKHVTSRYEKRLLKVKLPYPASKKARKEYKNSEEYKSLMAQFTSSPEMASLIEHPLDDEELISFYEEYKDYMDDILDTNVSFNGLKKTAEHFKTQRSKRDLKVYLSGMDINGLIESFFEEFLTPESRLYSDIKSELVSKLEAYFKSANNDFYSCDCNDSASVLGVIRDWSRHRYSIDDVESGFSLHTSFVGKIKRYEPRVCMFKFFKARLRKISPDCKKYEKEIKKRFHDHRNIRADIKALTHDVCSSFTLKRILELMSETELLAEKSLEITHILDEQKKLCSEVVNSIPDNYIDLYPRARTMHRNFHIIVAPTNAGKTWTALQHLKDAADGVYLAPLRLLAYEQFDKLNQENVPCSLWTGEEKIDVPFSRVQSSTIEMLDLSKTYDIAVIDECQMIADRSRGGAWSAAILGACAGEIYVCTAPEAEELIVKMVESCHDTYDITHLERKTTLVIEDDRFLFPRDVRKGDALIVFSRQNVYAAAAALKDSGFKLSLIYGALPYDVRHEQAEKFSSGENDVVIATDAIGMGMNLPISRVVFLEQNKFDGYEKRPLSVAEVKQIGGRAGRYGVFDTGLVNTTAGKRVIRYSLESPNPKLESAVIGFPKSLLGIDGKLSEIMSQWAKVTSQSGFIKGSLDSEINLCRIIEDDSPSKEMTFNFVMIPFDNSKEELVSMWVGMFEAETANSCYDVDGETQNIKCFSTNDTAVLENNYKKLDLMYHYCAKFGHSEFLQELIQLKLETSQKIAELLSRQSFKGRTCRTCGRTLPWGYKLRICEQCHDADFYAFEEGTW